MDLWGGGFELRDRHAGVARRFDLLPVRLSQSTTGAQPTCETAGVLGPVTSLIGSIQAMEAIKILAGRVDCVRWKIFTADLWTGPVHAKCCCDCPRGMRIARRAGGGSSCIWTIDAALP